MWVKLILMMLPECYRKFEYMYIHIFKFTVRSVIGLLLFTARGIAVHLGSEFDVYLESDK